TLSPHGINAGRIVVAQGTLAQEPQLKIERTGNKVTAVLSGLWTAEHARAVESLAAEIMAQADRHHLIIDLGGVHRLDTLGAWVLDRTRHELGERGLASDFVHAAQEQDILLNEVAYRGFQEMVKPKR